MRSSWLAPDIYWSVFGIAKISMLHPKALRRLASLARGAEGGILEIGPYIGGSTLALAVGNRRKRPHAAIEVGGSHDHPKLPSSDIVADWRANLARFGYADAALMCEGWSYRRSVREKALAHIKNDIGLFFLDADGEIIPAVRMFAPYLREDCIFAIDDYHAPGAQEKAAKIKPWIDEQVAACRLRDGQLLGGTWFGQLNGAAAREYMLGLAAFTHDEGAAYMAYFESDCPHDDLDAPARSPLLLFEDGRELGPAHAPHVDIRTQGKGRFSHWRAALPGMGCLFFSASDNTNPSTNGRHCEADLGAGRVALNML